MLDENCLNIKLLYKSIPVSRDSKYILMILRGFSKIPKGI